MEEFKEQFIIYTFHRNSHLSDVRFFMSYSWHILCSVCRCLQDRQDDVASRQVSIDAANRSGQRLLRKDGMSSLDRSNIQKDLENLNARWKKVGVPARHPHLLGIILTYIINCINLETNHLFQVVTHIYIYGSVCSE